MSYLGAYFHFGEFNEKLPAAPRSLAVGMKDYILSLVQRFKEERGKPLRKATSPYVAEQEWGDSSEEPGRFQADCASYVTTVLFAARVGRADCSTAVQRLCTQVSRWAVAENSALIRLKAYLEP